MSNNNIDMMLSKDLRLPVIGVDNAWVFKNTLEVNEYDELNSPIKLATHAIHHCKTHIDDVTTYLLELMLSDRTVKRDTTFTMAKAPTETIVSKGVLTVIIKNHMRVSIRLDNRIIISLKRARNSTAMQKTDIAVALYIYQKTSARTPSRSVNFSIHKRVPSIHPAFKPLVSTMVEMLGGLAKKSYYDVDRLYGLILMERVIMGNEYFGTHIREAIPHIDTFVDSRLVESAKTLFSLYTAIYQGLKITK